LGRLLDDVSSERFRLTSAVADVPITMVCWYRTDDLSISQTMMCIGDATTTANHFHQLVFSNASDLLFASSRDGAAGAEGASVGTIRANLWYHCAGVWRTTTDRSAYLDRIRGDNTASKNPVNLDRTNIGMQEIQNGNFNPVSGRVAEAGIWDIDLNDGEINRLANGERPDQIRAGHLVAYWPLVRPGFLALDMSGNVNHMDEINGPIDAIAHPPLKPDPKKFFVKAVPIRKRFAVIEEPDSVNTPLEKGTLAQAFNGTTSIAQNTTADLDSDIWSCVFWLYKTGGGESFPKVIAFDENDSHHGVYLGNSGNDLIHVFQTFSGTNSVNETSSSAVTPRNTWVGIAVTFDGSTTGTQPDIYSIVPTKGEVRLDLRSLTELQGPSSGTRSTPPTGYCVGNRAATDRAVDGRIAHLQYFDRILREDELLEALFYPATIRRGLTLHLPLQVDGFDRSGNNLHATLTATSTVPGPPLKKRREFVFAIPPFRPVAAILDQDLQGTYRGYRV